MKELHGSASAVVAASPQQCLALLQAVERYPDWYPEVVRAVDVLERDPERVTRARTKLHVARGPLAKDFDLLMAIAIEPGRGVTLTRLAEHSSDQERFEVHWRLEQEAGTRIDLRLDATLSVPRMLPLGGVGDGIAEGFVAAAARALA